MMSDNIYSGSGAVSNGAIGELMLTGECPRMHAAAFGTLRVLSDFNQANDYIDIPDRGLLEILVTVEIDWSWTRIMERFVGVITERGTRVSRAAELLGIMGKPGVLGAEEATRILTSGSRSQIVCAGNEALVYVAPA